MFQFASPVALIFLPVATVCFFLKIFKNKSIHLKYPLTQKVVAQDFTSGKWKKNSVFFLRYLLICILIILAARPQFVDIFSKMFVNGIDIVISLDVSGSMTLSDDWRKYKKRIDVAKEEAVEFAKKRENDQIGFIVFAVDTMMISPITLDKHLITKSIQDIELGVIQSHQTSIGKGLASAISRLRGSKAKSKVVIFLTDGQSTNPEDIPVDEAISYAKEFNAKVYTIGIGSKSPIFVDNFGRAMPTGISDSFDPKVLKKIASQTGGEYFQASNPEEMQTIYEKINQLEKMENETDIYTKSSDIFWPLIILACLLLFFELLLTTLIWKGVIW